MAFRDGKPGATNTYFDYYNFFFLRDEGISHNYWNSLCIQRFRTRNYWNSKLLTELYLLPREELKSGFILKTKPLYSRDSGKKVSKKKRIDDGCCTDPRKYNMSINRNLIKKNNRFFPNFLLSVNSSALI